MQLGAIQPINVAQISQANSPARPAAYVPTAPTSGNEPAQAPASSPFSGDNLKKYAPYIIGAVILFYILNRKK